MSTVVAHHHLNANVNNNHKDTVSNRKAIDVQFMSAATHQQQMLTGQDATQKLRAANNNITAPVTIPPQLQFCLWCQLWGARCLEIDKQGFKAQTILTKCFTSCSDSSLDGCDAASAERTKAGFALLLA